ncbi:MAG: anion transporter [Candidatus Methanomethylophilaceae archaeon]|nr:anion transporter [Candidatus Methanomethylophilaceae archaeon]
MEFQEIAVLIIFVATYLLIAFHKTPLFEIKRPYVAAGGALLMILAGTISLTDAFDAINYELIFLLIGMMCMVAGLEHAGFFTKVTDILLERSTDRFRLMLLIMLSSAILSAVALNDAVVLMFTPIVIKCCRKLNVNPIPFLVGTMMSANIGSIATAVGNPQNAFIVTISGMDFITYSLYSLPIAVVCLAIAIILVWSYYRNKLDAVEITEMDEQDRSVERKPLMAMIIVLVATFIAFALSGYLDYELYQVALVSGGISLLIISLSDVHDIPWAVKRVDWGTVLFFIGLFVIIGAASKTGLIDEISNLFPGFRDGEIPDVLSLSVFSAVLSNLVSNVPAVMLISEMMPVSDNMLWITLAASSTLAGNTTLIGSAANMIVAERSEKYGVRFDFLKFMIIGVIVTVCTVAISDVMILLMFN